MKLEIWMIVGAGVAFVVGFGAVTVLLLGLHAEIRRLSRVAEAAQRLLVDNLRQSLPPKNAAPRVPAQPVPRAAPPTPMRIEPAPVTAPPPLHATSPPALVEELALPLVELSAATASADPPIEAEQPQPEPTTGPTWNPDSASAGDAARVPRQESRTDCLGATHPAGGGGAVP